MAYRAFEAWEAAPSGQIESPVTGDPQSRFAPLELTVIALAEADPVASIGGVPTRFGRAFERWFGFERPKPLADARLEALRRFAVLARVTWGRLPVEEVRHFLAAGFTRFQARLLQRRAAASTR